MDAELEMWCLIVDLFFVGSFFGSWIVPIRNSFFGWTKIELI